MTKDGQLVAFHDDKLDRVTNSKENREINFSDLSHALIGGTEPIPLLTELEEFQMLSLTLTSNMTVRWSHLLR